MCIAIYKPRQVEISRETLAQCFSANPDGAGFMFAEKGRLNIQKGFFKFQDFWDAYEQHQEKHAAIHFRIKTHGKIDEVNCHPFRVNHTLGFIHNGTISNHGTTDHSDTYMFNEEIIKPMMKRFGKNVIYDESIKQLIESYIGWSKLVFLNNYGDFQIFNEDRGHWFNGAWYSNSSYKVPEPKVEKVVPATVTYKKSYPDTYSYWKDASISKYQGKDIYEEDWVKTNWDYHGIPKGSLAYVDKIYTRNNTADITLEDGTKLFAFPGIYLDFFDWEKDFKENSMTSYYGEIL